MISLNSLKNANKSEISQNVSVNVHNDKETKGDTKISYPKVDVSYNSDEEIKTSTDLDKTQIFDYYENILPNFNNEYYNNLCKVFTLYIDILNEGRYKKLHKQNILFIKDYLKIINWLAKTYITNNQNCDIKIYVDESIGCSANDGIIDSITCTYKSNYVNVFTSSPEIVNILQMLKIDKSRIINKV